jgi:hypothetical protein
MEHLVDFNFIIYNGIKNGLTILQSIYLANIVGIFKKFSPELVPTTTTIRAKDLEEMGFVVIDGTNIRATPKGLRVFRNIRKDNSKLASSLRLMYPPGMKDDKWPWRGTIPSIAKKLDQFNKLYPDITNEEIAEATKEYLEKFTDDTGRSLLAYFILKDIGGFAKSILAEWVYARREKIDSQKSNKNYEQL